jgi:hypothetical protein
MGIRTRWVLALTVIFSLLPTSPAFAAVPANDTAGGAVAIDDTNLPFADSVDTTEATTDADDAQANQGCGAPATDASVWYKIEPTEERTYLVDVSGSDYTAGVIVATGSPGSLEVTACGPMAVGFIGSPGETFWIIAFDDQGDGGGNGGTLEIVVDIAPPPPEVAVTVDPLGTFDKAGNALISGTLSCSGEADFVELFGTADQSVGRFTIRGFFGTFFEGCPEGPIPWTAEVTGETGQFKGGRLSVTVEVFACLFECTFEQVEAEVRLRGN